MLVLKCAKFRVKFPKCFAAKPAPRVQDAPEVRRFGDGDTSCPSPYPSSPEPYISFQLLRTLYTVRAIESIAQQRLMRWLQLRFDFDMTVIRRLFYSHSTAIRLRYDSSMPRPACSAGARFTKDLKMILGSS